MKTTVRLFFLLGLIAFTPGLSMFSQVSINTTGVPPVSSAMLDIKSTTGGLLIPRMTQGEMTSINNPANGLQVFCTTDNKLYLFLTSINRWKEVSLGTGELLPPATYSIGAGGSCVNTVINGTYWAGVSLTSSTFVTIQVNVSIIGTYSVTTNTINGYGFSASGEFSATGVQTINLMGSGTPAAAQIDQFLATASNSGGTCTFDIYVWASCPGTPTVLYGTQTYNTIQISSQCWLKENLNIGTRINGNIYQTNNSIIEKHCYDNIEDNCTIYGGLYQWFEAMQYVITPGARGICPEGWHIPTVTEWDVLRDYLGGQSVAGGKMKETGTQYWESPNTGATNSSGFSDRGAGTFRHTPYNYFYLIRQSGIFWTSTQSSSYDAYRKDTNYSSAELSPYNCEKDESFSVRCIKDL
jgi:uncharacterized protein (TIGR02145 family)